MPSHSDFTDLTACAPLIVSEESEVAMLAANDPVFADLVPDDYRAYVRFRIATAFPAVIGPEMHGRFFGFHPQVLANSFRSLLHQQTNLGHMLKAYGGYRDRIIGGVVGVAVGNRQPRSKQVMAANVDAAQFLDVVGVIYKQAEGVKELLGNHVSARQKQKVSIEVGTTLADLSVFDPRDRSILSMDQASALYPKLISIHKDFGIQIGKVDGVQFGFAAGGEDGSVPFRGVGYTPNPAEKKTAMITDLRAECGGEGDAFCFAALCQPEWEPGHEVAWHPVIYGQDAGQGTVMEIITEGRVQRHRMSLAASAADPLLDIQVRGKALRVLRHASSVVKRG